MSTEKRFRFRSRWLGLTKWIGNKKIKFSKGFYETTEPNVADFLRKQKECVEITETPAAPVAPPVAPPAEQQESAETTDKPAKPSKSAK